MISSKLIVVPPALVVKCERSWPAIFRLFYLPASLPSLHLLRWQSWVETPGKERLGGLAVVRERRRGLDRGPGFFRQVMSRRGKSDHSCTQPHEAQQTDSQERAFID